MRDGLASFFVQREHLCRARESSAPSKGEAVEACNESSPKSAVACQKKLLFSPEGNLERQGTMLHCTYGVQSGGIDCGVI